MTPRRVRLYFSHPLKKVATVLVEQTLTLTPRGSFRALIMTQAKIYNCSLQILWLFAIGENKKYHNDMISCCS